MTATRAEMEDAGIDLQWRDFCAHMLIPLNKCRNANFSLPFRCTDERHAYEKCQYGHFERRQREMRDQLRAKKAVAAAEEDAAAVAAARKAVAE